MPILAFVLTTLVIMSAMFGGVWIVSGDSKGSPQAYEVFLSFAIILVMSFAMVFAYRKGLKKTLLAIGIPNLLFGATVFTADILSLRYMRSSVISGSCSKNNSADYI